MLNTLKRHIEKETQQYYIDKDRCKNLEHILNKKDKIDESYVITAEALALLSKQVIEKEERLNKLNWLITRFEESKTDKQRDDIINELLK